MRVLETEKGKWNTLLGQNGIVTGVEISWVAYTPRHQPIVQFAPIAGCTGCMILESRIGDQVLGQGMTTSQQQGNGKRSHR